MKRKGYCLSRYLVFSIYKTASNQSHTHTHKQTTITSTTFRPMTNILWWIIYIFIFFLFEIKHLLCEQPTTISLCASAFNASNQTLVNDVFFLFIYLYIMFECCEKWQAFSQQFSPISSCYNVAYYMSACADYYCHSCSSENERDTWFAFVLFLCSVFVCVFFFQYCNAFNCIHQND